MKHLVTLLTTSDLRGLERLVYVAQEEIIPAESLNTDFVIVVNTLDDTYYEKVLEKNFPLRVVRTESDGTAAKGKNSCHDLMLEEGYDYLTQFDGDDILYPTFLLSLEAHLKRMPNLDVLGILPCDILSTEELSAGHKFLASSTLYGSVWGTSACQAREVARGPGRHPYVWDAAGVTPSQDYFILQSRESCKIKMDERLVQAEDHLQSFKYLGEHQKGNLLYVQTMSSDMYIIDRSFPGSVQKATRGWDYVAWLQQEIPKYVPKWRSSFGELPCLYMDLLMDQYEKERWLVRILEDFEKFKNNS